MHRFSSQKLGLSLDIDIYSGFIQLKRSDDIPLTGDSDSEIMPTPTHITPEENELSIAVKYQVEKFKASFLEKGSNMENENSSDKNPIQIKNDDVCSTKN